MGIMTRIAGALAAIATLFMGAAGAQTLDAVKASGQVRVGILLEVPPYGQLDTQGQPEGMDIDVARAYADALGVKLELVPLTSPNRIPYLLTNRVDALIAVLAVTPERQQQIQFSEPYAGLVATVFAPKEKDIKSWDDLKGVTVATSRGSTSDITLTKNAPAEAIIQRYDDEAGALQAMLSGQADAVASAGTLINHAEARFPGRYEQKFDMFSQVQGIGLRPGEDDILAATNDFVREIKANGKLNEITQKWLNSDIPDHIK